MPGSFFFSLPDEIGGDFIAKAEWPDFITKTPRVQTVDLTTSGTLSWQTGARLLVLVPPATPPGGTVTLKGNAGDTGMTVANNNPLILTKATPDIGTTLTFVVAGDAGIWTAYFV